VYVINMSMRDYLRTENIWIQPIKNYISTLDNGHVVPFSVEFEEHVQHTCYQYQMSLDMYFIANPTHHSSLTIIFETLYQQLQLIKFYTVDTNFIKVWLVRLGASALDASGVISTDMER
jgi:obg-like ATPase 1